MRSFYTKFLENFKILLYFRSLLDNYLCDNIGNSTFKIVFWYIFFKEIKIKSNTNKFSYFSTGYILIFCILKPKCNRNHFEGLPQELLHEPIKLRCTYGLLTGRDWVNSSSEDVLVLTAFCGLMVGQKWSSPALKICNQFNSSLGYGPGCCTPAYYIFSVLLRFLLFYLE